MINAVATWGRDLVEKTPDYLKVITAVVAISGTLIGGGAILGDFPGLPEQVDALEAKVDANTRTLDRVLCLQATEAADDGALRACLLAPEETLIRYLEN